MRKYILYLGLLMACENQSAQSNKQAPGKAQEIVDKAITRAGGDKFDKAIIDFDFREHHYRSERNDGIYLYTRIKEDVNGNVQDRLGNEGFQRFFNNTKVEVPDKMAVKYSNSINSVIYFALLPYGLNDEAVKKQYLGEVKLEDKDYHKIRVTFAAEGGGQDFEDVYIYWISKDDYEVDFLAYEFHTEGGGQRFRKAVNPRVINGIRFIDYINYKPKVEGLPVEKIDSLFLNNGLKQISEIVLENVEVRDQEK
jgi:hypothetical protein